MQKFVNNFATTIASTFGIGDTFLQVTDATGLPALTGGDTILLTVFRKTGVEEREHEVVRVTAIVANQLTVVRSVEGEDASQFLAGDYVEARVTAASLEAKADIVDLPTMASLGMENVENKSSETIRDEITSGDVTEALGYIPLDEEDLPPPAGINNVVSSAVSIVLTSTPTLAVMTPTSYGVTVKLQDATSDTPKDSYHAIANKGAYPIRVTNSADTLLGFVCPGVKTNAGLVTASATGVWAFDKLERVGASAQLLTTNLMSKLVVVDIGSNREMILGTNASNHGYAVVYDRSTNTFGAVTLVRAANLGSLGLLAVSAGTDKVLALSVTTSSTAMEAVVLSVSGTTITVNTALAIVLAGNISDSLALFATSTAGLFAVIERNAVSKNIRALGVNGTTVATSAATDLTNGNAQSALMSGSVCVVFATAASTWITPYTIAGSVTVPTVTVGTGETLTAFTPSKFCTLSAGVFAAMGDNDSRIVTLSGTTITSTVVTVFSVGVLQDAIVLSSTKVLMLNNASSSHAKILTNTGGTASVGTAITLDSQTTRACLYLSGTDVAVQCGTGVYLAHMVDCSGASPVLSRTLTTGGSHIEAPPFDVSNKYLVRSPKAVYGTAYAKTVWLTTITQNFDSEVYNGVFTRLPHINVPGDNTSPGVAYNGRNAGEIWIADASTVITKLEAAQ